MTSPETMQHPLTTTGAMCDPTRQIDRALANAAADRPAVRPCAWCAADIPVCRRPGRPRLYCHQACRQRAYEHRHGFLHERTVRPLPGQVHGDVSFATGYERGGYTFGRRTSHALRTSVRPEGRRRETLCGQLAPPVPGRYFNPFEPKACEVCARITSATPLRIGVSASNELSRLRALYDEARERRIPVGDMLDWIAANGP
jgi:hypothetical protein